jgi:hypothetical protein
VDKISQTATIVDYHAIQEAIDREPLESYHRLALADWAEEHGDAITAKRQRDIAVAIEDPSNYAVAYWQGSEALAHARGKEKKLAGNTYLYRIDRDRLGIRLHNTTIVEIHADGTFTLNSGGWLTAVTMDRISENSPARLTGRNAQRRRNSEDIEGVWWLRFDGKVVPFFDGIRIDAYGWVI